MDGVLTGAAIQQLVELLGLSYKTSQQLDQLVDTLPSKRPQFQRHEIAVGGEPFEIYARQIMECLVAIVQDLVLPACILQRTAKRHGKPPRSKTSPTAWNDWRFCYHVLLRVVESLQNLQQMVPVFFKIRFDLMQLQSNIHLINALPRPHGSYY